MISRFLFISFLSIILLSCGHQNKKTYIVYNEDSMAQKEIAGELSEYLSKTYKQAIFEAVSSAMEGKRNIILKAEPGSKAENAEAYAIHANGQSLLIEGNSDRALIHGAYALLKKIGWKFYLSFEVAPQNPVPLEFEKFKMEDAPLKDTRIVFNWHNFMSGCTGWDAGDWHLWIDQSRKIGFNTIMVHAYGNNPMQPMEMNGREKEVGYLTTSRKGRDWGAQHVNDVRLMIGGKLFSSGEYGSEAAKVADGKRSESAVSLMQNVFTHAAGKSMNICYAIDVDTWMANPQEIITTLPAEALLQIEDFYVANPDHPEGNRYYKEQLGRLLRDYPQITHLAAWMRRPPLHDGPRQGTLWLRITSDQFPEAWKKEYQKILDKHPELSDVRPYPAYFAMSKIIQSYRGILDEINPDIELLLGSWELTYPPIADYFMPTYCGFIPLDYSYVLDKKDVLDKLARAGKERKLYPVVWAHHDDGRYIGRPYKSFKAFNSLLDAANADGYGVIHWTTHPLDLLFENYERQVWTSSENQPREDAVQEYCEALMESQEDKLVNYFQLWFAEGPMLGRETTDHFMATYEPYDLEGYTSALDAKEKASERIQLLQAIDLSSLNAQGKKEYQYQLAMEHFIISFFNNHHHIHQAYLALEAENYELAREHMQQTNPEQTIEIYARAIKAYVASKGELGVLVSLNLRWLPEYMNIRQRAGIDDIHINFQPTSHDPLAQSPGKYTFHIDPEGLMWTGLGKKEIAQGVREGSTQEPGDITQNWIEIAKSTSIPITTLRNNPLKPGSYTLELFGGTEDPDGAFKLELVQDGKLMQSLDIDMSVQNQTFDFKANGKNLFVRIIPGHDPVHLAGIRISPIQ